MCYRQTGRGRGTQRERDPWRQAERAGLGVVYTQRIGRRGWERDGKDARGRGRDTHGGRLSGGGDRAEGAELRVEARREGGWTGGGRGAAGNNYVWVPANMRQLPAGPGSPVLFGCAVGKPATVSSGAQDAAGQGRRRRGWRAGASGGCPGPGSLAVPPPLTPAPAVSCRVAFGKVSVGVSWLGGCPVWTAGALGICGTEAGRRRSLGSATWFS